MVENSLIENLIKIMKYEYKIYSSILELGEKKTDCLVANDTEALSAISEQENDLAKHAEQLNAAREQLILKICNQLGEDFNGFSIRKLHQKVSEPYKKELGNITTSLNRLINKLTARNGINQKLIENAMKYVDFNMQLIASPQPESSTYGKTGGEVSNNSKRSMLDIKY